MQRILQAVPTLRRFALLALSALCVTLGLRGQAASPLNGYYVIASVEPNESRKMDRGQFAISESTFQRNYEVMTVGPQGEKFFETRVSFEALIQLDTKRVPQEIRFYDKKNPKKLMLAGIFESTDESLQICVVPLGDPLPAEMKPDKEKQHVVFSLRRYGSTPNERAPQ